MRCEMVFAATGLCLILFLWVVRLRQDIDTRRRTERSLLDANERIRKSEALYRLLTEDVRDVVWKLDSDYRFTYVSPADERLRGYKADEIIGRHVFEMFTEEGVAVVKEVMRKRQADEKRDIRTDAITFEALHCCKNGGTLWGEVYSRPLRNELGAIVGYHGITREITERKELEEQIRQQSLHDPLTNLPNRRLLNERIKQALAAGSRDSHYGALLFIDLDNFKPLNDSFGHEAGDLLLIEAANRLRRCVREIDTIARIGGDEFVVLLSKLNPYKTESRSQAGIVAKKLLAALSEPYMVSITSDDGDNTAVQHTCAASIGATIFLSQDASPDEILKRADAAMYEAKKAGRNRVEFSDS